MGSSEYGFLNNREKVTIHVDKVLDCSAHDIFIQACRQADHPAIQSLVVDLAKTRGIRASGVGMLLMLNDLGKKASFDVQLVNCQPQVRDQLVSSRLLSDMSIS